MEPKVKQPKIAQGAVSSDAGGVETELVDLAAMYRDKDGNSVAYGDLTVQRLVEKGGREHERGHIKPYDTDKGVI